MCRKKRVDRNTLRKIIWWYVNSIDLGGSEHGDIKPFYNYIKSQKQDNQGVLSLMESGQPFSKREAALIYSTISQVICWSWSISSALSTRDTWTTMRSWVLKNMAFVRITLRKPNCWSLRMTWWKAVIWRINWKSLYWISQSRLIPPLTAIYYVN